jgi:dolichol-phosphate mannosyltransferase
MRAYVLIPTYNERENIETLIPQILQADERLHVLVVDDNSPDGTAQVVEGLQRQSPRVHLLKRAGRLGYGTAVREGIQHILQEGADWLIQMDADFSHDPKYLPALLSKIENNDLVIGSRYVPGGGTRNWGWARRTLSATANRVARTLLALPVADCTGGFRCYRRELVEKARLWEMDAEGYGFLSASLYRCHCLGARIAEVPIIFVDRRFGKSKLSKRVIWEAIRLILRLWWQRVRGKKNLSTNMERINE